MKEKEKCQRLQQQKQTRTHQTNGGNVSRGKYGDPQRENTLKTSLYTKVPFIN